MTTYTADDFAKARFAEVPGKHFAARVDRHSDVLQWKASDGDWYSDEHLAAYGWVPVPAGSYTRTDEEATLRLAAEQIAEAQAEATAAVTAMEKAEQERDEAQERNARQADMLAQPRPLTPDAITDEMVQRGAQAATPAGVRYLRPHEVREVLTAALTEPPTRPEGAAELQAAMADLDMDDPAGFADLLAERGVRAQS